MSAAEKARALATGELAAGLSIVEETRASADVAATSGTLREIHISKDITWMVDQAESALLELGGIYVRSRALVHVVRDKSETRGLVYPDGQPVIARMSQPTLRERVNGAATWIAKRKLKTGETRDEATMVPPVVPSTLFERGQWRLPPLEGVIDAPAFRVDGSILDEPGYDAATRLIYEPSGVVYPSVPTKPAQADAARALATLLEPFSEFAFVADTDRMALVALVLTLIGRAAIPGPTPMFTVRATTPGSGKGLAVDAAAIIATGRSAPKRAAVTNDDELRKALLAYALEAPALVVLDNVEGAIGSPVLAALLTTDVVSDRLLGLNESRTAHVRFVLIATGNNLTFRGDTGRRVVPIDLDPRCEHPEDRTFARPNLLEYVRSRRPQLVAAALTMLRAFVVAGRPAHGSPAKGSYETWDALIRGAIRFAGGADPLEGASRIRLEGDEDLERLRALLRVWYAEFQSKPTTIAEAIKRAGKEGALFDALAVHCRSGVPESKPIGGAFRRARGRIVGGLELVRGDSDRDGVMRWQVREVES